MSSLTSDLYNQYKAEANAYITQHGLQGPHNGPADAFRHAYVSGAMTQDYGSIIANLAGQANEIRGDLQNSQPAAEKNMDLINNEKGRILADGAANRNELALSVLNALNSGDLITSPNGQTEYNPFSNYADTASEYWSQLKSFVNELYTKAENLVNGIITSVAIQELLDGFSVLGGIIEEFKQEHADELSSSELADLNQTQQIINNSTFEQWIEMFDPLVLDLDGDGVETTSVLVSSASFDFGIEDGKTVAHGWVSPDDGHLAFDKNGNGTVDDISELFGSNTASGFAELAEFDENGDGVIDENDSAFVDLFVWQDLNSDGISSDTEMTTLIELGIASLNLEFETSDEIQNGNAIARTGSFTHVDGTNSVMADVEYAILTEDNALQALQSIVGDYDLV